MTVPEMQIFGLGEYRHARVLQMIEQQSDEGALVDEVILMAEAFALFAEKIQARRRKGVRA